MTPGTSSVAGWTRRLSGWLASMQLGPKSKEKWSVFFNGACRHAHGFIFIRLDCKLLSLWFHWLPSPSILTSCLIGMVFVYYSALREMGKVNIGGPKFCISLLETFKCKAGRNFEESRMNVGSNTKVQVPTASMEY